MLSGLSAIEIALYACAAIALDCLLGEPRRWHPLIGFGALAARVERALNRGGSVMAGVLATALLVAVPAAIAWMALSLPAWAAATIHVAALYFALGARSLHEHIAPIAMALASGQLAHARELAARVVSRDLEQAPEGDIAKAAVESALENGNDAIFAALFWFALLGAPGAIAYRLVNTLDAMWGYRTPRFLRFGWAAARLDDVLNFVPARLTAATYALLGSTTAAVRCWRAQARAWASPNAGPVMAAGAGALRVKLGGAAVYDGVVEERPPLGCGGEAMAGDIDRALRLVRSAIAIWLAVLLLLAAMEVA